MMNPKIYTVCIDREGGEFADSSSRMWNSSYTLLEAAKLAVLVDWANMNSKVKAPEFIKETTAGDDCHVFQDYEHTGYCWTIQGTTLLGEE